MAATTGERALRKTSIRAKRAASEAKRSELVTTSVVLLGSLASFDEDEHSRDESRDMATNGKNPLLNNINIKFLLL